MSILGGALLFFTFAANAQEDTTLIRSVYQHEPDTSTLENVKLTQADDTSSTRVDREHSPRIAVISSAILPGLGQVYNKKYWKVPIIYGAGAMFYYLYDYNNVYYVRLKTAYDQISNDLEVTDPDLSGSTETQLEYYRNYYRKNRDYQIIFMGLLYFANIVDAMVDAHMYNYDISKDLSMQLMPTIIPPSPGNYTASCGLKLKLSF